MVTVSLHFPPASHSNEELQALGHLLQTMSRMPGEPRPQDTIPAVNEQLPFALLHTSPDLFFSEWSSYVLVME